MSLLVVAGSEQVAGDVLHLLGQQRRAVHLHQPQHAVGQMQLIGNLLEKCGLIGALGV